MGADNPKGEAKAGASDTDQTNDREDQQIGDGKDEDKPGHLLVGVAERSGECWADLDQHNDET
jgi:hypothetical protein